MCSCLWYVPDLEFSRLETWSRDVSRPVFTSLGLGLGLEPQSLGLGLGLGTSESWSWSWSWTWSWRSKSWIQVWYVHMWHVGYKIECSRMSLWWFCREYSLSYSWCTYKHVCIGDALESVGTLWLLICSALEKTYLLTYCRHSWSYLEKLGNLMWTGSLLSSTFTLPAQSN